MILFFLFFIVAIVAGIVCYISDREDASLIWAISFFITGLCVFGFIITACATVSTHNDWCTEQAKIEYIEERKTIMYFLETQPENSMLLVDDIADYNKAIMQGRRNNDSWWFNWETYDFWDELEPIELN